MARISSASSQEAFAFGQWLSEGWSQLSKTLFNAAPRAHVPAPSVMHFAELASTPAQAFAAEARSRLREPSNLAPASSAAMAQNGAFLDLMAQISHDLRTPLNAVIGFSDVMSSELLGPVGNPRYREYADDIRSSGRLLLKAAEDTLAMTSLLTQSADRTQRAVSISALARDAWSEYAADAASRGITLSFDHETLDDVEVLAAIQPLKQAMTNLFSEAMARTSDGNGISLSAVPEDDTVRVEVLVTAPAIRPRANPGSLAMSLARTLLELQGAGLLEIEGRDGSWRAVTILDRAAQRDFFAGP